ncbi:hypothetical protein F7U66_00570 [Vibrio parahaemolyticus]|nr:hypothetical protein [Vibrio parahaemolyticus]
METQNNISLGESCSYDPLKITGFAFAIMTHIAGCETVTLLHPDSDGKLSSTEVDSFLLRPIDKNAERKVFDFDNSVKTGDIIKDKTFDTISVVTSITRNVDGETFLHSIDLDPKNGLKRELYHLASGIEVLKDHPQSKLVKELLQRPRINLKVGQHVRYPILNISGTVLSITNHINGTQHIEMSTNAEHNFDTITCDVELFEEEI